MWYSISRKSLGGHCSRSMVDFRWGKLFHSMLTRLCSHFLLNTKLYVSFATKFRVYYIHNRSTQIVIHRMYTRLINEWLVFEVLLLGIISTMFMLHTIYIFELITKSNLHTTRIFWVAYVFHWCFIIIIGVWVSNGNLWIVHHPFFLISQLINQLIGWNYVSERERAAAAFPSSQIYKHILFNRKP